MKYGFLKVAAISPDTTEGALGGNARAIKDSIAYAHAADCSFVVFPRCVLTGGGTADKRLPLMLAARAEELLLDIASFTLKRNIYCLISTPLRIDESIAYVTALVCKGKILAVIPESDSPVAFDEITLGDYAVPYTSEIILKASNNDYLNIAIVSGTLSEGLSRADRLIKLGASIIMHTATQPVNLDSHVYEAGIISAFTSHTKTAYVYSSGSISDRNTVSKTVIISEVGEILASSYDGLTNAVISDIDTERLLNIRVLDPPPPIGQCPPSPPSFVEIDTTNVFRTLTRSIRRLPYLPDNLARYNYASELISRETHRSIKRTGANKVCLMSRGTVNFMYALTVLTLVSERYGIPKNSIAVLTARTDKPNPANEVIDQAVKACGFYHAQIPSKFASDHSEVLTAQAVNRWASANNAAVIGLKDMTDIALGRYGTPLDRVTDINIFSALPKTYLNAAALGNTLTSPVAAELRQSAARIAGLSGDTDSPYDIYDFAMYYFGGLGMSKSKVMYLMRNAFEDYTPHRLTTCINHFLSKYLSDKTVPQDLMQDLMTHPTPFYRIGGGELTRPYISGTET